MVVPLQIRVDHYAMNLVLGYSLDHCCPVTQVQFQCFLAIDVETVEL